MHLYAFKKRLPTPPLEGRASTHLFAFKKRIVWSLPGGEHNKGRTVLRETIALVFFSLVMACSSVAPPNSTSPGQMVESPPCATVLCCPDCPRVSVAGIIDGDTFDSGSARIRLFGVDTPERGDACFKEAADGLKELAGDSVRVESGPRREDRYGRILYYVYTEGGESIDETLVREGLALAWGWDGQYRDLLVAAEEGAREEGRGCLW